MDMEDRTALDNAEQDNLDYRQTIKESRWVVSAALVVLIAMIVLAWALNHGDDSARSPRQATLSHDGSATVEELEHYITEATGGWCRDESLHADENRNFGTCRDDGELVYYSYGATREEVQGMAVYFHNHPGEGFLVTSMIPSSYGYQFSTDPAREWAISCNGLPGVSMDTAKARCEQFAHERAGHVASPDDFKMSRFAD